MKAYGRLLPIFSTAFVLVYGLCVYFNWALFTYFPAKHQLLWLVPPEAFATGTLPMFWYGWLSTTIIAALLITGASAVTPIGKERSLPPTFVWAAAIFALIVITVALAHWFRMH